MDNQLLKFFFHSTGPIAENPQYIVGFQFKIDKSLRNIFGKFSEVFHFIAKR